MKVRHGNKTLQWLSSYLKLLIALFRARYHFIFSFYVCCFVQKFKFLVFSLTWPASMLIYWNKRKLLHKKRVQLPEDSLATPTWPPWRLVKTLYTHIHPCVNNCGWKIYPESIYRMNNKSFALYWCLYPSKG